LSEGEEDDQLKPRRQYWASKMQFVLACIGYSVGLSNVWRFPYIMFKSGGGESTIAYYFDPNQAFPFIFPAQQLLD
jgi:solute carrier family 6 (neurotransmitter transporter, taurine) member 6